MTPRFAERIVATVAAMAGLLGGCVTAPVANPEGRPAEALTLSYLLDRGCMAYLLQEASEADAMRGLGLRYNRPLPDFIVPSGGPWWNGHYHGAPRVTASRGVCSLSIKGDKVATYRATLKEVVQRRLAVVAGQETLAAYKVWVPGQETGCGRGVRYSSYPKNGRFLVELSQVDCTNDPLAKIGQP